ncbi:hypothetical protein [Ktedonobacter racemifer]|uniref:Uncharacterized protein n=1 Tax=Ktedonobacter racemifer DSM 44963 TaxID=485913 RepID=D6TQ53_KTERA|nr:hypothetical protein [Ktedonobacter racemifer]EFH85701.1 hypothetical protein Krac_6931 [Ktedonobacter racemifer DSM 44963]
MIGIIATDDVVKTMNTTKECLFILCRKEARRALVDELSDKIEAAQLRKDATGEARIALYGETQVDKQGFLLLSWDRTQSSERFRNVIRHFLQDEDVIDYLSAPLRIFSVSSEDVGLIQNEETAQA